MRPPPADGKARNPTFDQSTKLDTIHSHNGWARSQPIISGQTDVNVWLRQNVIAIGASGRRLAAAVYPPVRLQHGQFRARTLVGPFALPCLIFQMITYHSSKEQKQDKA